MSIVYKTFDFEGRDRWEGFGQGRQVGQVGQIGHGRAGNQSTVNPSTVNSQQSAVIPYPVFGDSAYPPRFSSVVRRPPSASNIALGPPTDLVYLQYVDCVL